MKPSFQNILAAITGVIVTVLGAVLLFPLIRIVYAQNISIGPDFKVNTNDIALTMIELLWVAIASYIGGFVTSWIAGSQKVLYALIAGILLFLILFILETINNQVDLSYLLLDFSAIMFCLCGGLTRKYLEVNRQYKNSSQS